MPANTQTQIEIKQCNCFIIITKYWFGEGEEEEDAFSSKQASQSVSHSFIHSIDGKHQKGEQFAHCQ